MVDFIPGIIYFPLFIVLTLVGLGLLISAAIPRPRKGETIRDRKGKAIGGSVLSVFSVCVLAYIGYNFRLQ